MLPQLKVAVAGLGYWGPNLVRSLWETEGVNVVAVCDPDRAALTPIQRRYPSIRGFARFEDLLADDEIDAIAIATPVHTHFPLARAALRAGKHVFVEKPMATSSVECRELIELAEEQGLLLMPGHTFLYSPPVRKIKDLLETDELGKLFFATFSRVNLGIHQSDASVVRDLGPHDFSILLYWLGQPTFIRAIGRDAVGSGQLDVAFIDMGMPSGALVHVELSWLAPTKLRRTVLVGSDKMVVYEDTATEQVRVFDRGVEVMEPQSFGEFQLSYRSGDVLSPRLDSDEPLRLEMEDFANCVATGSTPVSTAELGYDVVRMIEATEHSLQFNGSPSVFDASPLERRRGGDRRRSADGMPVVPLAFAEG
ncbi:MAG: Gfo/Idh/MocA family protein [Solirubrobacteraceae bacterium]